MVERIEKFSFMIFRTKRSSILACAFIISLFAVTIYILMSWSSSEAIKRALESIDNCDSIVVVWLERLPDKSYTNSGFRLTGAKKKAFRESLTTMLTVEIKPSVSMARPYVGVFCILDDRPSSVFFPVKAIGASGSKTIVHLKEIARSGEKVSESEITLMEQNTDIKWRNDFFDREFVLRPQTGASEQGRAP